MNTYEIIDDIVNRIKDEPLWGNWYIKGDHIGSGTLSKVYRIEAQRSNRTDVSAVKIEVVTTYGKLFNDADRKRTYLESQKNKIIDNESNIMHKLRCCPNVVAYEDEDIRELYINGIFEGYYALIRMELLKSVYELIDKNEFDFSESNVIKFAREIGYGLKATHDAGEIHRDVKPENLFISDKGVYKVGDFNVSKKAESSLTRGIGTEPYMAPEVHRGSSYTGQADIYSFGLCLYQMMNNNLLPFEENSSFDMAVTRRQNEKIEIPPKNASLKFGRIILKACAFDTSERYQTMDEMLNDLDSLECNGRHNLINTEDKYKTVYAGNPSANETVYADEDYDKKYVTLEKIDQDDFEPKRKKISFSGIIPIFFIAFLLVGLGIFASVKQNDKNDDALSNQDINSSQITSESSIENILDDSSNAGEVTSTENLQQDSEYSDDDNLVKENQKKTSFVTDLFTSFDLSYATEHSETKNPEMEAFQMSGSKYKNGVVFLNDSIMYKTSSITYNILGDYSKISFYLGHLDNTDMNPIELNVYLDNIYYESFSLEPTDPPKLVEVDIQGKSTIRFSAELCWDTGYCLANLSVDEDNESIAPKANISNANNSRYATDILSSFDLSYATEHSETKNPEMEAFQMSGSKYKNGVVFLNDSIMYKTSSITYNILGDYSKMSFYLGHLDNTDMNPIELNIYLDNIYYESFSLEPTDPPKLVEVDIQGKSTIRFSAELCWDTGYCLANLLV